MATVPPIQQNVPTNFPIAEVGTKSPYPTLERVIMVNQNVAGILVNWELSPSPSEKYTKLEKKIVLNTIHNTNKLICSRLSTIVSNRSRMLTLYLFSLSSLAKRRQRKIWSGTTWLASWPVTFLTTIFTYNGDKAVISTKKLKEITNCAIFGAHNERRINSTVNHIVKTTSTDDQTIS